MDATTFYNLVCLAQCGDPEYVGRNIEWALFGNTSFFHWCTCYVDDLDIRATIRYDVAVNGISLTDVVKKYADYIDKEAPCMHNYVPISA